MKTILCHLSDIHLDSEGDNLIFDKIDKIASAINYHIIGLSDLIIFVSGDIAQTGKSDDYYLSIDFFNKLQEYILKDRKINIHFLFVPGNHDLDFSSNINHQEMDTYRNNVLYNSAPYNNCILAYQKNFIDFCTLFENKTETGNDLIKQVDLILTDGYKIHFNLVNTSWLSKKKENYGDIFIPEEVFININLSIYDLIVSIFHHPFEWFQPTNRVNFERYISQNTNLIFVGHEHTGQDKIIETRSSNYEYHSGEVLQDRSDFNNSAFTLYYLNTVSNTIEKEIIYRWDKRKKIYTKQELEQKNIVVPKKSGFFKEDFLNKINQPNMEIQHNYKDFIKLSDLYVYPDLLLNTEVAEDNEERSETKISGDNLISFILSQKRVYISGDMYSGKTALGKIICQDLIKLDLYPLFLSGEKINRFNISKLDKVIDDLYIDDICEECKEIYEQMSIEKKAIIIDDINKCYGNESSKEAILKFFCERFEYVIVLSNSLIELEILNDSVDGTFLSFSKCSICELGYYLRHQLIRKWYLLGREQSITNEDLNRDLLNAENTINSLKKDANLPTTPLTVILILQQLNVSISQRNDMSNCGYLFDFIISRSTMQLPPHINKSVITGYLTHMAYYMFTKKKASLTIEEIYDATVEFNNNFNQKISWEQYSTELSLVNLVNEEGKVVTFTYPYIYYYFIAKYFAEKINKKEIMNTIKYMTQKLYVEDYGRIMVFLCHFSKDERIIQELLNNSCNIFQGISPLDLESGNEFLHSIGNEINDTVKLYFNPENNLEERTLISMQNKDKESAYAVEDPFIVEIDDEEDEHIKYMVNLDNAFKSMEVMGQILKNYPGSIDGELQNQLVINIHMLGMKTLSFINTMIKSSLEPMVLKIGNKLKKENNFTPTSEILISVKKEIANTSFILSYSLIRKIAACMANDGLIYTLDKSVLNDLLSFQLVKKSVHLNNFGRINADDIISTHNELVKQKNLFADLILKTMVVDHYYVYGSKNFVMRQKLSTKLGISGNEAKILNPNK